MIIKLLSLQYYHSNHIEISYIINLGSASSRKRTSAVRTGRIKATT